MISKAEEFVSVLLKEETHAEPIDSTKPEDLSLPEWFDEEKFKRGQMFFNKYYFGFGSSYIFGLTALFGIPSIVKILIGSRRGSTPRTAYRRYKSTFVNHIFKWIHHDLKPGSESWQSLETVRRHHHQAMRAAAVKGHGIISQRDICLTLFCGIVYSYLKPDTFGIFQANVDDWESYNHMWGVIGHMIGLQDRYNICTKPFEETHEVCQVLLDRVLTPFLDNPPEYYEYMARVTIEGISALYPPAEAESVVFLTKSLAGVPGYISTERERILLRKKIMKLSSESPHIGVASSDLLQKCAIQDLPQREPRLLYLCDYDSLDNAPEYKRLTRVGKFKLALGNVMMAAYSTAVGRVTLNYYVRWQLFIGHYFPYIAIWRFGFTNVFKEDLVEDVVMKLNSEYYKPRPSEPWYRSMLEFLL